MAEPEAEAEAAEALAETEDAEGEKKDDPEAEPLKGEEEEEGECLSRTGVESVDSVQRALDEICEPKLKKNYLDYLKIVKQIQRQNITCQKIKDSISTRCCNDCRSECEEREIRVMRCCLEKENVKLTCLMQQAMRLQGEDPERNWKEVIIATTIDEDFMPTQMDMNMSKRLTDAICNKDDICAGVSCDPCAQQYLSSSSSSEECMPQEEPLPEPDELGDFLRCLLHQGDKGEDPSPCGKMNIEMAEKALCRMAGGGTLNTPYQSARSSRRERNMSDSSSRDNTVHRMQRKINKMQGEVSGLISKRERLVSGTDDDQRSGNNRNIKGLEMTINRMQKSVDALKNKLMSVTKDKVVCHHRQDQNDVLEEEASVAKFTTPRKSKTSELKQLRTEYNNMKLELVQKNAEICDMRRRMKPLICRSAAGTDNPQDAMESVERSEVMVLRTSKKELEEEQEEFQCLIKEQAEQLEDYRRKYMEAQQKFEEQKVVIGKMDSNNKRIEDQINSEVMRIKSKFQEKIAELSQYPCILESEQLKLAQISKEKDDLEGKLKIICKELKSMQAQQESSGLPATGNGETGAGSAPKSDCTEALKKCKIDYALLEKQHSELLKEKTQISEQLVKTKQDLNTLRSESAKIIARTKERSECTRISLQEHVDKIEKELAQCRANACLSVSDREEVIKEMTGQMNTLSFSFDAAQKQIKSLKNQIGFLASDNTYPVKS